MNDALLELCQISYRYPDGSVGLDACSIAIQRGSRNVLIGANGSMVLFKSFFRADRYFYTLKLAPMARMAPARTTSAAAKSRRQTRS